MSGGSRGARRVGAVRVVGGDSGRVASRGSRAFIGGDFPLGTLVINVTGAFLLSFLTALVLHGALKPDQRLIWGTGFCGGYTTFSTFELEAEGLLSRGQWALASTYILGNLCLGFLAILAAARWPSVCWGCSPARAREPRRCKPRRRNASERRSQRRQPAARRGAAAHLHRRARQVRRPQPV